MKQIISIFLVLMTGLSYSSLKAQEIDDKLIDFIREDATSPDEYIINKFNIYDVVLLGEHHIIKENLLFIQELIPKLYKNGIYAVGMEFGASEVQGKLDQLINAEIYDEDLANEIMYTYNVTWAFKEYIDIYKAAWKINRSLPDDAKKFRIINLSYIFQWDKFTGFRNPESMKAVFPKGPADKHRAEIIEKEILNKNEKILALVGTPHAYTKYASAYFMYNADNFFAYDHFWLGNRLFKKYPNKVFNIILHQSFTKKYNDQYMTISPLDGSIEKLMRINDNRPVGFDLIGSPIGNLRDQSLHNIGYENFKLGQLFDGYIFLEPLNELEGCTVVKGFVDEENIEHTLQQFPDPDWHKAMNSLKDIISFIENQSKEIAIRHRNL